MLHVNITIQDGVRKVDPYYHEYKIAAKSRWFGKTLVEWCCSEFGEDKQQVIDDIVHERMYVMSLCGRRGGPVKVSGWGALEKRPIAGADLIHRTKHVHEPPVHYDVEGWGFSNLAPPTSCGANYAPQMEGSVPHAPLTSSSYPVEIIYQDASLLVVNKPSGMPTHPSGNYYYNSVTEILKHNLDLPQVWPCHRLDKVTSGVLVLGKTREAGTAFSKIIQNEKSKTRKEYVARVVGKFPYKEPVVLTCPVFSVNGKGSYITPSPRQMPIASATIFKRLEYNAKLNHSIVWCQPLSGRTHQIRIHLRNMGFPIANDHVYNPSDPASDFFKHNVAKLNVERQLYDTLYTTHPHFKLVRPLSQNLIEQITLAETIDIYETVNWDTDPDLKAKLIEMVRLREEAVAHLKMAAKCDECGAQQFSQDSNIAALLIWLHAIKFLYENQAFETRMPEWCGIQEHHSL